jgi:hypothetical protein
MTSCQLKVQCLYNFLLFRLFICVLFNDADSTTEVRLHQTILKDNHERWTRKNSEGERSLFKEQSASIEENYEISG